jgi:hypothetical protein
MSDTDNGLPAAVEAAMQKAAAGRGETVTVETMRAMFRAGLLAWPRKWITDMPLPTGDGEVYSQVLPVPAITKDTA